MHAWLDTLLLVVIVALEALRLRASLAHVKHLQRDLEI